jgi:hypothetical protein
MTSPANGHGQRLLSQPALDLPRPGPERARHLPSSGRTLLGTGPGQAVTPPTNVVDDRDLRDTLRGAPRVVLDEDDPSERITRPDTKSARSIARPTERSSRSWLDVTPAGLSGGWAADRLSLVTREEAERQRLAAWLMVAVFVVVAVAAVLLA